MFREDKVPNPTGPDPRIPLVYTKADGKLYILFREVETAYENFLPRLKDLAGTCARYERALDRILAIPHDLDVDSDLEEDEMLKVARAALANSEA